MLLPMQNAVARASHAGVYEEMGGMFPSSIVGTVACKVCQAGCNRLPSWPGFIRKACRAACNKTVCKL